MSHLLILFPFLFSAYITITHSKTIVPMLIVDKTNTFNARVIIINNMMVNTFINLSSMLLPTRGKPPLCWSEIPTALSKKKLNTTAEKFQFHLSFEFCFKFCFKKGLRKSDLKITCDRKLTSESMHLVSFAQCDFLKISFHVPK